MTKEEINEKVELLKLTADTLREAIQHPQTIPEKKEELSGQFGIITTMITALSWAADLDEDCNAVMEANFVAAESTTLNVRQSLDNLNAPKRSGIWTPDQN